uniref:Conotoxin n=1 Tax=Conus betulinus TaxID=89764 RepID=A0A142C187_CONBE|nr:conotoxin [Conus betulinus]
MGMRMMFTVFLLVVLATTVVSFAADRESNHRNRRASNQIPRGLWAECCEDPPCRVNNMEHCPAN